jgi:hypothetical protein
MDINSLIPARQGGIRGARSFVAALCFAECRGACCQRGSLTPFTRKLQLGLMPCSLPIPLDRYSAVDAIGSGNPKEQSLSAGS